MKLDLKELIKYMLAVLNIDYITAEGASSGWYYRKWKSGKVEAWGKHTPSATAGSLWSNGIYYYDTSFSIPAGIFSDAPIRAYGTSNTSQWWLGGISAVSTTSVSYRALKPVASSQSISFSFYLLQL